MRKTILLVILLFVSANAFAEEELERYQEISYRANSAHYEQPSRGNTMQDAEFNCASPEECEKMMQEQFSGEYAEMKHGEEQFREIACNTPEECKSQVCSHFPERCEEMQHIGERYTAHRGEYKEAFPGGFSGPGDCRSPQECKEYCQTHEDECRQAIQEEKTMMYPKDMDVVEKAMYRIFQNTPLMDPQEFKQYCPDAEAMVDAAIKKMQEQGIKIKVDCHDAELPQEECATITPEAIRERMIKHASFMCKMLQLEHQEGVGAVMMQMMEMRSQAPEIAPLLDKEAERMYEVHREVLERREETFFDKIRRMFGLKEKKEAERLRQSVKKLEESIKNIQKLQEQVVDHAMKDAISLQVIQLESEKQNLLQLAEEKEGGASSISGAITGFFAKRRGFFLQR